MPPGTCFEPMTSTPIPGFFTSRPTKSAGPFPCPREANKTLRWARPTGRKGDKDACIPRRGVCTPPDPARPHACPPGARQAAAPAPPPPERLAQVLVARFPASFYLCTPRPRPRQAPGPPGQPLLALAKRAMEGGSGQEGPRDCRAIFLTLIRCPLRAEHHWAVSAAPLDSRARERCLGCSARHPSVHSL